MNMPASFPRRRFLATAAAAAGLAKPAPARAQSTTQGVVTVAVVGESGPLDPMPTTADLLTQIDQHIFEALYAVDPALSFHPVLAAAMPAVSADGRQYTVPLRTDAKFHDGSPMTADDVLATLQRWLHVSPRGRQIADIVETITAPDPGTLRIALKQPYAPMISLLGTVNGGPAVMPRRIAAAPGPLSEFVGTGPYRLIEHKPDAYIRLTKFDGYVSPPGKPFGYAGARQAFIDELRFVPVPNPVTRVDGLISGLYDFADTLTPEGYARLANQPRVTRGLVRPSVWAILILNTRAGLMTNVAMRRAVQAAVVPADMMAAAFGDRSLWSLEGSLYAEGTQWYDPDTPGYDLHDPARAAALLKQAGYNGQKIRILVTTQYDYMYKIGQVAQANLEDAGAKVDLQVMEWATLLQKRQDPALWDGFVTSTGVPTDPATFNTLNPAYPGWWDSPDKRAAFDQFVTEPDQAKRVAIWQRIQALFYSEVPTIKIGSFFSLYGISTRLTGYTPLPDPAFWNVKATA